jgi:hypothetical protein
MRESRNQRAVKAIEPYSFTKEAESFEETVLGQDKNPEGGVLATRDYNNVRSVSKDTKLIT